MIQMPQWADDEAWEALYRARRLVEHAYPDGRRVMLPEWQHRGATSLGARSRALLEDLLYPPSYIARCVEALVLYLNESLMSERSGFWRPRRTMNSDPRYQNVVPTWG